MIESACSQNRRPLARTICVMLLVCIGAAMVASAACGQEPLRVRRNFFGCHNLMDGGPAYQTGIDWTQEMNGPGFVFDWVRGDFELWMAYCFQRNLIPCMRLQNGNGGELPSPGYMGNVVSILCNYKLAHPEYADRLVYLQLWNEPGDARDYVDPATFSQFMIDAWNTIQTVVANAAAQNPAIAGTFKIMTPGQNGPAWWEQAWAAHPQAKFCFDVWATHPYPESDPPWFNHHDGVAYSNAVKTIDSYVLDLDKLAENHGGYSRRGVPVMITETCYGDHLGISYEGYPKTTRDMAASYYQQAFTDYWYKWPEIVAVHHFILCNWSWEAFALVPAGTGSVDTDGDGILEPASVYPQYTAIKNTRISLENQNKLAPARISKYTGPTGSISGTVTRSDTGAPVKYATLYTDGYEFGHVSLYDGGYVINDVPVGTYTLTCHKVGYLDASQQVTVTAGNNTVANFSLVYTGKDATQFYFVDTAQGSCPGCQLCATYLGQTFTTPSDVGYIKFAAAKPNVGNLYLKFSILDGDNPNAPVIGTWNSYYLEGAFGGEMIGGEAPGDGIPVQPNRTYFLKIERTDGQPVYLYASNANPYPGGCAWVGNNQQPSWDLYGCYRGNRVAVVTDVGTISGNVKNSSGQNLQSATVATTPAGHSATTDANGNYTITNVPVGTYSVTASKIGYQSVTQTGKTVSKNQTTTVNFTLTPTPTGTISGNVKNSSGVNLQGATVSTNPGDYSTTTDANGNYTIANVPAGTYSVTASKNGYNSSTQTGKTVSGGQTTTCNFTLTPSAPFSGLANGNFEGGFFNDPDIDHQTGNSWHRFSLDGVSKSGGDYGVYRSSHWSQSIYESSWTAGIYQQCTNATVGNNYTASVYVRGSDTNVKFWIGIDPFGGTNAASPNVVWSSQAAPGTTWTQISKQVAAQSSTITVFIKAQNTVASNRYAYIDDAAIVDDGPGGGGPTTGTISGNVKNSSGQNLSGATVSTDIGGYTTTTDTNGNYSLVNVAPGTYDVTAVKSGYNAQTQTGKTVTAGQTTTVNFTLTPSGGSFSGIANGNFEGGFFNDPDVDHQTGNSWHRFVISGVSKSGGDYGVYRSSHWSQTIYESNWTAGIYQQATGATVGSTYTASVYVRGADSNVKFWVGIDPYGGTNPSSANVQWSAQCTPGTTWTQITKQVTAQSSTITMFIKAQNTIASNRNAWIDDASLSAP